MNRLEPHDPAWSDLADVLQRNGAIQPKPARPVTNPEQERERWQVVIDHQLLEWARDPNGLADEGIVPPSVDIIQVASQIAGELRDAGVPGPQRVAATGDGGIVFVRQAGPLMSTLEVDADGLIELALFRESRLVSRQRLR